MVRCLNRHERILLEGSFHTLPDAVVADKVVEDEEASESFQRVVEFVAVEVASQTTHGKVRPMCSLNTVQVLVVLNDLQSVFEGLSVKQRIKRIPAG